MSWAVSDLDFTVVDRARTLGGLLRLLFALMEAFSPKDVADLLTKFNGLVVVDPETAGRWLRDERRPSKQHLRLIVRLLQSRGLVGSPPARDRIFMRIAAFYAKVEEPEFSPMIAPARRAGPGVERAPALGERFRALREDYELALALQFDLTFSEEGMPRFEARRAKPRPFLHFARPRSPEPPRLLSPPPLTTPARPKVALRPSLRQRLARTLFALIRNR